MSKRADFINGLCHELDGIKADLRCWVVYKKADGRMGHHGTATARNLRDIAAKVETLGDPIVTSEGCPECGHDAIRNIQDLAALVGAADDTETSISRRMFKDTECGIIFAATETGVSVAGYAEGSSYCIPGEDLDYPFTGAEFWAAVKTADAEGCAVWEECN